MEMRRLIETITRMAKPTWAHVSYVHVRQYLKVTHLVKHPCKGLLGYHKMIKVS